MKLTQINIRNYKNIKHLDQKLDGNILLVKGDNEKGKTTFSRAFLKLITRVEKPEIPVTIGAEDGMIKGHFEDPRGRIWTVTYEFTNEKEKIALISPDGITTSKITEIRELFNYYHIDVDEFISWSHTAEGRRRQRTTVLNLLTTEERDRFTNAEALEKEDYKKRTIKASDYRATNALYESMILNDDQKQILLNKDKVADDFLIAQSKLEMYERMVMLESTKEEAEEELLNYANAKQVRINDIYEEITLMEEAIENKKQKAKSLELEKAEGIKELELAQYKDDDELNALKETFKDNPEISRAELTTKQSELEDKLKVIENLKTKQDTVNETKAKVDSLKEEIETLSDNIDRLRENKKVIISNADLPIKGLEIEQEEITLNGLPFTKEQLSTSQIMTTVFKIMVALNKKTPIFHVGRVESLGSKNLKELVKIAKDNNYQVFFDKVESDSDLKIEIIEDYA